MAAVIAWLKFKPHPDCVIYSEKVLRRSYSFLDELVVNCAACTDGTRSSKEVLRVIESFFRIQGIEIHNSFERGFTYLDRLPYNPELALDMSVATVFSN